MKTVILAGGYGTRIRDVASDIPKPMIPIGTHPILWHIMKYYSTFNFNDFVLCLGYKGDVIKDYFLNYKRNCSDMILNLNSGVFSVQDNHTIEDWSITFAETGLHSMTGARVKYIKKYVENDDVFFLTYGDGVGDINIKALLDFHKSHGKIMTVTAVHPPARFGQLNIAENKNVRGFNEKPQSSEGWISAGYFVCNKKIFDYLSDDKNLTFEREPIENIVRDGQLMAYQHDGFWHPMDTSREYQLLNELWDLKKAPWRIWDSNDQRSL